VLLYTVKETPWGQGESVLFYSHGKQKGKEIFCFGFLCFFIAMVKRKDKRFFVLFI